MSRPVSGFCGRRKKRRTTTTTDHKSFQATMSSYHVTCCWSRTVAIRCWLLMLAFYLSLTLASPPGPPIKFSVLENSAPGTLVGLISTPEQSVKYVIANNKDDVTRYFDEGLLTSRGRIETIRELDHEVVTQISFMVYEQKSRSLTKVTVNVDDVNDNSPHFRKTQETLRMSEATPINKTFAIAVAVDADSFPNDVRQYSIIRRSRGAEIFELRSSLVDNAAHAQLVLTASLDRERVPSYEMWIEARDGGSPQRSDVIKYELIVDDVNDNRPAFVNGSRLTVAVREDMRVGEHVVTATASDRDEGENGAVRYSIDRERSDSGGYFRVDSVTGSVRLARRLDAEESKRHEIWLRATDRGRPSLTGTTIITVLVGNVNDNDPTIVVEYMKPERTKISEDVGVGEVVARVTVADPDADGEKLTTANVTLSSTDSFGLRTEDNITYYLYIKRKLDRESKAIYHITLETTDFGSPPRSASKTVTFHIEDVNDNAPVFDDEDLRVQISASASPGTYIYQVTARDADVGENARIRYRILPSRRSGCCNINIDSGLITTARTLDLEGASLLPLVVEAKDMGRPASLWSTANVTLELFSHEDALVNAAGGGEPPRFISRQYSVEVRENTAPETCVLQLACFTSTDPSSNPSTSLVYELNLEADATAFPFRIDSVTGRLYTAGVLDREIVSSYHTAVVVRDKFGLTDEVPLVVELTDTNDNRPTFDPVSYLVNVSRHTEAGWPILALQATDADLGANGRIKFRMETTEDGALPLFRVEPSSGLVSTHGDLSVIGESQLNLTIAAVDGGGLMSSNRASVIINLSPAPFVKNLQFAKTRYEFSTVENTAVGGASVGWVSAFYPQANRDNEGIAYSIQADPPMSDWLFIRPNTGEIFLQKELDREALPIIRLKIVATSLTETNTFAATDLRINVLDINDNRPHFSGPATSDPGGSAPSPLAASDRLTLDYTWPLGEAIHTISATDGDAGLNGTVLYALADSAPPFFAIDSVSGELRLVERLPQNVKNYTIVVTAMDRGTPPQSSSTRLTIETRPRDVTCPRFAQRKLSINVAEDLPVTSWIKNLEASVVDNSTTIYDLKQADDSRFFALKRENGALYLKEKLDRETREVLRITVLAAANPTRSDLFGFSCADRLTVDVHVLDANDNSPQLLRSFHYFRLTEDRAAGHFVGKVEAYDEDAGENGRLIYSLLPKNDQFDIEYDTGKIFLVGSIDREERQAFEFEVMVSDGGGLTASAVVHIRVDDVNDCRPAFVGGNGTERRIITDKLKKGSQLADMQAQDGDEGANSALEYDMRSESDIFAIDSGTGVVSLSRTLEQRDIGLHLVNVTASDRGSPPLASHKALQVRVVGEGAAAVGLFDEESFVFVTGEQQLEAGSSLGSVAAAARRKRDTTAAAAAADDGVEYVCKYYLSAGNADGDLYLNETSGELFTTRRLVHARKPKYEVTIKRVVDDVIDDTSSLTAFVYVQGENMHVPVFERGQYAVNVTEDSPVGTEIWKVVALDGDAGRNGRVRYSISSQTPANAFEIDGDSGILRVAAPLDREAISKYLLVVNASDGALRSPHHASASVLVSIVDVNDNHPVIFTAGDLYVSEDRAASTEIAVIMARDGDVGANAAVTYGIEYAADADPDLFSIDSKTGSLTLTRGLDYESCLKHCFNVTATDGVVDNADRLKTEQVFCVHVLDVNDVEPTFERSLYRSTISEGAGVATFVATVRAHDGEDGMNGQIIYSITNTSGSEYFQINPRNGVISLRKELDFEQTSSYSFEVVARDGGSPALTGRCVVEVLVSDVNDNSPVIHPSHYNQYNSFTTFPVIARIRIEEVIHEAGTLVYTVVASDRDSKENGRLHYSITEGDADGDFEIGVSDGRIHTTRVLDRENASFYWLRVSVSDGSSTTTTTSSRSTASSRRALGIVQVEVVDWNDNTPAFLEHSYSGSVTEQQTRGQYVTTVRAHDADAGLNARVTYSLSSDDIQSESLFEVDHLTGVVTSAGSLDREGRGVHYLQVTAQDSSLQRPLNSSVSLVVHVSDINDNYPMFVSNLMIHQIPSRTKLNNVQVAARDADEGVNGHITYRLLNYQSSFTIERNIGRISQYSILPDGVYKLKISASDDGSEPKESFAFVQVEIGTVPASASNIAQHAYRVEIPEAVQVDHRVLTLQLAANIRPRDVVFELVAGNEVGIFDLTRDGDLIVINPTPLDYETRPNISLVATVKMRNFSSNLTEDEEFVSISNILQDENDNPPVFSKSQYRVSILEEQPVPAFVTKVQAYDIDVGSNSVITYSIIAGVPQNPFEIDERSGEIVTKFPLDREIHEEYILTIRAADQGFPPRRTTTSVRITVLDINDHAPVLVTPSERIGIREDVVVGTVIMQATANDVDLYPIVSFQLIDQQSNEYFTIHRSNGNVMLKKSVDYETMKQVNLTIKASDEMHEVNRTLVINIEDYNDNPPVFSVNPPAQHVTFDQSMDIGREIVQMTATDVDSGEMGRVKYAIINRGLDSSFFEIDQQTGKVTSTKQLKNISSEVQLQIEASDCHPPFHTNIAALLIQITNVESSNHLRFTRDTYSVIMSELVRPGHVVTNLVVSGIYDDHQECFFKIIDGDSDQVFSLQPPSNTSTHSCTTDIIVRKSLDYEQKNLYNLKIAVRTSDQNNFQSFTDVEVALENENDNPPSFESDSYVASIIENSKNEFPHVTRFVVSVSARDPDHLLSEIDFSIIAGDDYGSFYLRQCIPAHSGCITINAGELDFEFVSKYSLTIQAKERQQSTGVDISTAVVTVDVVDVDESAPKFAISKYQKSVVECAAANSTLFAVVANDDDAGSNLTYTIDMMEGGQLHVQDRKPFQIHPKSGQIAAVNELDYEGRTWYEFQVNVLGSDGDMRDHVTVQLHVLPFDEYPPVFDLGNLTALHFTVPYGSGPDSIVGQVSATDDDAGDHVTFAFGQSEDSSFPFQIDSNSGMIFLRHQLLTPYDQTIRVYASSSPKQMSSMDITIEVTNIPEALSQSHVIGLVIGTIGGVVILFVFFVLFTFRRRKKRNSPSTSARSKKQPNGEINVASLNDGSGNMTHDNNHNSTSKMNGAVSKALHVKASNGINKTTVRAEKLEMKNLPTTGVERVEESGGGHLKRGKSEHDADKIINLRRKLLAKREEDLSSPTDAPRLENAAEASSSVTSQQQQRQCPIGSSAIKTRGDGGTHKLVHGREIENGEIMHRTSSSCPPTTANGGVVTRHHHHGRGSRRCKSPNSTHMQVDPSFCQKKMTRDDHHHHQRAHAVSPPVAPNHHADVTMAAPNHRHHREYLSSSSTSAKCPFTSPTPSGSYVSSVSSSARDQHQWTPEFTPLADVIDEIAKLRQEFSRDVSGRPSMTSPYPLVGPTADRPPLLTSTLQNKAAVVTQPVPAHHSPTDQSRRRAGTNPRSGGGKARGQPPSYDATMRRMHSRKRSLVSTTTVSSSSSSTSPHTLPSPDAHGPAATSLRLTITRPDGVVQSATKVNGGLTVDTSGERMVLV